MTYLGLDIGTSGLRALLMDSAGGLIGSAEHSYPTAHKTSGWSEQNPADWITAIEVTIAELRATYPAFADLAGIGVAGHMHGAVLLDKDGDVIRPCIMWNDTRSHAEAAALDNTPEFRAISGNIVFPGFTAPKLEWLRTHEPQSYARVAKVLLPAGFVNHYLTGDAVADMSDSAGTSWMDVAARDWSQTLLDASNMRRDQMPRLVEGCAPAGVLRPDLAIQWGLNAPVTLAGGAGDNAAAACGMGVLEEGHGFVSLGTSGVLLLARDSYAPAPDTALHTFCHAVPDRWYQMGVMLSAADSLSWLSKITSTRAQDLTEELGAGLNAPSSTQFFPYLSGERTPHNDAEIRAGFTGLGQNTTRADMTQAVLEGVCFALRDALEAIKSTGGSYTRLYVTGGGSGSDYWLSLLATVLQIPLHVPEGAQFGAALGAARLGMAAATDIPLAQILRPAPTARIIPPDPALVPAFEAAYARFRAGYPILKSHPVRGTL
ncbi:MAG: xylulokinase [Sulfitobacter sp.]